MAPIGEAYFPPLDRCFSEQHQLLYRTGSLFDGIVLIASRSWKNTYFVLSQLDDGAECAALKSYLADPQTVQVLAHAFSPFQQPSPQSKSTFETKTSAINATPSPHAHYDIKELQEDTLWLSKETNIDEVSALRIALLEWQTRSCAQLLQGDFEEQVSYQDGGRSASIFQPSPFDPGSSFLLKSQEKSSLIPFEETGLRRRRLLETYLSERRCILKCSEFITFTALFKPDRSSLDPEGTKREGPWWLRTVGANILSSWKLDDAAQGDRKDLILQAVDALRARLEALTRGSGWFQDEGVQEDIELAWMRNQILETIHIMQICLNLLCSSTELMESSVALSWFRLMRDCEFYDCMQLVSLHASRKSALINKSSSPLSSN